MWLKELVRVLRPGGYLFLTFAGAAYAAELGPADRAQFSAGNLVVSRPEDANVPARYASCAAYHPPAYVTGELARGLTVLTHVPGQVVDSARRLVGQDAYLFRKPN